MARVYISSTYEDLLDVRKAALDAARRLEHQAIGMEDYGAAESRPLERCVADVRSCDAYVGILGWRYGYIPPGASRSITRLEYDAAGEAGIPRLIFLSPEREGWDRSKDPDTAEIAAFREHVRVNHIVARFTDALHLKTEVLAALGKELRRGQRFPELLPYFCDRLEQRRELQRALFPAEGSTKENTPLLFVLHGDNIQSHGKFIDCLKHRYVADMIEKPFEKTPVKEYQLRWPRARAETAFMRELIDGLGEAVCGRAGIAKEAIATRLSDIRDPVLLTVPFPLSQWDAVRDVGLLNAFARFWTEWPFPLRCWPTIVLLYVQYQTLPVGVLSRWLKAGKVKRRNELIESTILATTGQFTDSRTFGVLTRLDDIAEDEALMWARTDDVRRVSGDGDVEGDVRGLFSDRKLDRLPMETLGKALKDILQRYFAKGS